MAKIICPCQKSNSCSKKTTKIMFNLTLFYDEKNVYLFGIRHIINHLLVDGHPTGIVCPKHNRRYLSATGTPVDGDVTIWRSATCAIHGSRFSRDTCLCLYGPGFHDTYIPNVFVFRLYARNSCQLCWIGMVTECWGLYLSPRERSQG